MGLFDRTIARIMPQVKADIAQQAALVSMYANGVAAMPNLKYETFAREGYGKNELVFACIEEWATDIAEPEIVAYNDTNDGPVPIPENDAVALLTNPNPFMSGDDLLGGIEMYKRLAGNAYTLKVRSAATKVVQLWPLRPDRVNIVPSDTKHIERYEYRIGTYKFDLPTNDVIQHKTRNPFDDFYGMPPLMAAAGRVDIDNFMKDMVKGFLQTTGMPAGILQVAGKVTEGEKQLIRQRFRTEFGGENTGNIMIADGGKEAPSFTPLSMPLGARGLVVPELDEIDEARICMVFHVPLSLAGARLAQLHASMGQAGREADRSFFTEQQLVPEWKLLGADWTRGLWDDFRTFDRLDYDLTSVRSLSENEDSKSTRVLSQLNGTALAIMEARMELGRGEPKPDDIFLLPFNVTPTRWADIIAPPEPVQILPPPSPAMLPPGDKVDNLPAKRLGSGNAPQVIVINAHAGEVEKLFEYGPDGEITKIRELRAGE